MNAQPERTLLPTLTAGNRPTAIVPQTFDDAYRIANAVCVAGMAPVGLDTPEKATVAILHGLEVGLSPMNALQSIAVINGRPCIWGDGAVGLVRASGQLEYLKEWIEGNGDQMVAHCEVKRKGEPHAVSNTFSVRDAMRAGLWDSREKVRRQSRNDEWYEKANDSPWFRYPKRMLQARARSWPLRDTFADVLKGLHIREELEDMERDRAMKDITPASAHLTPPSPPSPPSTDTPPNPPSPAVATSADDPNGEYEQIENPTDGQSEFNFEEWFERFSDAIGEADDEASIEEIWNKFDPESQFGDGKDEDSLTLAHNIKSQRAALLGPGSGS